MSLIHDDKDAVSNNDEESEQHSEHSESESLGSHDTGDEHEEDEESEDDDSFIASDDELDNCSDDDGDDTEITGTSRLAVVIRKYENAHKKKTEHPRCASSEQHLVLK